MSSRDKKFTSCLLDPTEPDRIFYFFFSLLGYPKRS